MQDEPITEWGWRLQDREGDHALIDVGELHLGWAHAFQVE